MSDTPGAAPVARLLVTKIVSGYVRKNQIVPADMPTLIAHGLPIVAVARQVH